MLIKKYPKISMITITFNSEKYLEETIKSVVGQNYPNLEYIIVDGGSKDRTMEIVSNYNDEIACVISEPDKGISDAFNKGINVATGDVIGIINSDDLQFPDALINVAESFEQGIDVIRGNIVSWNESNGAEVHKTPIRPFSLYTSYFMNAFKHRSVCHACTFITKEAYKKWGGYQLKYKYMMDRDLLTRLHTQKAKFKYIDRTIAISRVGGVTTQTHPFKKIKEVESVCRDNGGSYLMGKLRVAEFLLFEMIVMFLKKIVRIKR